MLLLFGICDQRRLDIISLKRKHDENLYITYTSFYLHTFELLTSSFLKSIFRLNLV